MDPLTVVARWVLALIVSLVALALAFATVVS